MAGARVLHFGEDTSHRVAVLRLAGYTVDSCASLEQMISWFRAGRQADVVCVSEEPECAAEGVLAVARTFSQAPLVLFRANTFNYLQRNWNLEVPPLTPPEVWLVELARLHPAALKTRSTEIEPVAID
jgi:hypothetical protein